LASSPKAPNPYQQAAADQNAQVGAASSSAVLNNPNEQSPYGSVNYQIAGWEQIPGADGKMQNVPRYTRTTTLSPDEQRIAGWDTATRYNLGRTGTQQSAKIGDYLNQGINTQGWQPWQTARGFSEATDRPAIEQALMARQTDAMGRATAAQEAQLAARGMSPGAQGWSDVQDAQQRAATDARQQAYLASGQEARSNYDAYLAGNAANNQLRQAQTQEGFALRNQPINEIMALLGGSQVNMPQFSPFSRQGISAASPGNYMAANYQNQLASTNAFNQGLFSLAGAVGGGVASNWARA
jgi:hypothetical protein